jgi:hypothetical protein
MIADALFLQGLRALAHANAQPTRGLMKQMSSVYHVILREPQMQVWCMAAVMVHPFLSDSILN